jgi:hypothetical protein
MNNNRKSFTLTEVLLASAMFALISLAVFHAFANGLRLWGRGEHVLVEGDMAIFLERMAEDLRQTATISGIPFKGTGNEVSFPSIVLGPADANGSRAGEETAVQIGAVRYSYDPGEKKIYRSQAAYGQALKSVWSQPTIVASMIEDMTMTYYFTAEKGLEAKSEADQGVPMGVMVDVQFMVERQIRHMRRFLLVPVGGGI